MKKLSAKGVKILKTAHLLFVIMWVGGSFCMALLLLTTSPQESHQLYMRSFVMKLIDDWLIIPGAVCVTITGFVYGFWTNWGFFKHRWIVVKWILNILLILLGTFLLGVWVNGNVYPIEDVSSYTLDNTTFFYNVSQTIIWGFVQIFVLLFIIIISVFKPWKSKKNKK